MLAWSQLNFCAIPASISAVSLTSRQLGKMLTVSEDFKEFKMYRKGKDISKRDI
jgi:hypothetical protein